MTTVEDSGRAEYGALIADLYEAAIENAVYALNAGDAETGKAMAFAANAVTVAAYLRQLEREGRK